MLQKEEEEREKRGNNKGSPSFLPSSFFADLRVDSIGKKGRKEERGRFMPESSLLSLNATEEGRAEAGAAEAITRPRVFYLLVFCVFFFADDQYSNASQSCPILSVLGVDLRVEMAHARPHWFYVHQAVGWMGISHSEERNLKDEKESICGGKTEPTR